MKWGIVVDSSCDLRTEDFKEMDIDFSIVPLKILVGDKEYVDDNEIQVNDLLKDMKACKGASQTACPSPGDFIEAYKKSENVICFALTSALSGTYNSGELAKNMLNDENPAINVHVCDSKSTAGNLVMLINKAIELIKSGKTFDEISEQIEEYKKTIQLVFTLGSYDNLIKTGRMSNFAGAVASTLNIRAVCIKTPEGEIKVVKKARGQKAAYNAMIEIMKKYKDSDDIGKDMISISHCNNFEGATYIKELIENEFDTCKVEIRDCKGLTTFYTMEGGILVGY